ncbi:MAG: AGE family epimerase/isomerase [Saprospiraceae bacterium]|nr:AGE family epimerase/isomerase [Saprospiraceae bacterium]
MLDQNAFQSQLRQTLANILQWWAAHAVDETHGGFIGRMDGQGGIHPHDEKGIILHTRLLWTFSAAARQAQLAEYRPLADRAHQYLMRHFWDEEKSGFYWMLDYQGRPSQTKKQVYAQAFAIYALSEYYLLNGQAGALDWAMETFEFLEQFSRDRRKNGYLEAFNRDWQLLEDLRLSEKDANEAKTLNTHLHVLEAYTHLYRAGKREAVRHALINLVELFLDKFIDPHTGHMRLFFDENWQLKSHEISFGHDIECSWLLTEAAEASGDESLLDRARQAALLMAAATLRDGVDADGGLFNEAGPQGVTDTDKHWWPQAEAVVGFLQAWEISGDQAYYEAATHTWHFIQHFMLDTTLGDWYWRVNREGRPITSEDKISQWKCPYHTSRACIEALKRLSLREGGAI